MRLHQIISSDGGNPPRKRVGRGEGGGRGKTSGRGHKGQRARSGYSLRPGFESGHIPLYRRLPKRGFKRTQFQIRYGIVNLAALSRVQGDVVNRESLVAAGLIDSSDRYVKILGTGEVDRAFTVHVEKISATARRKIEAAGGTVALVDEPATADSTATAEESSS